MQLLFKLTSTCPLTETTQSVLCRRARANACSWTLQATWCLQTAAKKVEPIGL